MRKLGVLVVVVVLLFASSVPANAMLPITQAMIEELEKLITSGKQSNAYLNHSIIDLVYVSDETVSIFTYTGEEENLAVNIFNVPSNTISQAANKITSFVFELTNRYRPETELSVSGVKDDLTVHVYTYGAMKDEAVWAVVYGLPECLGNPAYHQDSDGGDWVDKYSPENIVSTISTFTINSTTYIVNNEIKTMDVAPEVKDDRTFVPVRYLAYSLGVPEEGITWDGKKQEVTITKDETTIGLTIGSNIQTVNDEQKRMDVVPYIKNGRTMLPAKWIAEPLGATVTWDETTQQIKIEVPQSQSRR